MKTNTKYIFIEKSDEDLFHFESENHTEDALSECQLMSLLGAMLGVTITHPNNKECSWSLYITRISPE